MESHVMPVLMAWGLLGIVVSLAELMLLFLCLMFGHHLREAALGGHTRLQAGQEGKCELVPLHFTSGLATGQGRKYTSTLSVTLR